MRRALFQPKPTREEQVAVRLARLTFRLMHDMEQVLKPFGLTGVQYNALRILNGAGREGLCGTDLRDRLLTAVPDVPRLLDRLDEAGLVTRERDPENRRFVVARISPAGVDVLVKSASAIATMHRRQWKNFSAKQLDELIRLLDQTNNTS